MHVPPRKNDQGIPGMYVIRETEDLLLEDKRRLPFMVDHFTAVAALIDQPAQQLLRGRRGAYMDLPRADSHDGCRPGPAALIIGHHLGLVDHGHIIALLEIQHLDRG